jgi:hypothetical protein
MTPLHLLVDCCFEMAFIVAPDPVVDVNNSCSTNGDHGVVAVAVGDQKGTWTLMSTVQV